MSARSPKASRSTATASCWSTSRPRSPRSPTRSRSYWPVDEHPVTIHDVRPIAESLAFDRNGFVLVDEPTQVTAFTDKDELARYCRQTEALVQRLTGADKVVSFGPVIRTNASGAHGHNQPCLL